MKPIKEQCSNCRFEMSCGYSPLAMLGYRADYGNNRQCPLGLKSEGKKFFQPKAGSPLWEKLDASDPNIFRPEMAVRDHAYEFMGSWHLTENGISNL